MQIFNFSRHILAAIAFTLVPLGAVHAGSIFTPMLFQGGTGNQLICIASNVHTNAITVTVRIVGQTTTSAETCTLPAGDRNGCQGFKNNDTGRCIITINGLSNAEVFTRVRGVMFSRKMNSPFTMDVAVEAR